MPPPDQTWLFLKARANRPYLIIQVGENNLERQSTDPGPKGVIKMGRRPRCSRSRRGKKRVASPLFHLYRTDIRFI